MEDRIELNFAGDKMRPIAIVWLSWYEGTWMAVRTPAVSNQ